MRFVLRLILNGVAIFIAAALVSGVVIDDPVAALKAGVVLGLINATIRPVLGILAFPITLLTLGLFTFVLNAVCFALTAYLVRGFSLRGVAPALIGALIVSIVSWALSVIFVPKKIKNKN
jgi:putative membrane protein